MKKHLSLLFILGFSCILLLQLVSEQVLLTDDMSRVIEGNMELSFWDFIMDFLNSHTMSSRPISGLFYAPSIYLIRYFGVEIYYMNYLFYLISLVMIYIVITKFYDRKIAILGTFLYSLLPLGTSTIFSPIMMNSSLATIFYTLSLFFIWRFNEIEKRREEKRREEKRREEKRREEKRRAGGYFFFLVFCATFFPFLVMRFLFP